MRPASPGNTPELGQPLGGRKGVHLPSRRKSPPARRAPSPSWALTAAALRDADAMPDDRPGRGLVRGPEPHRAQALIMPLAPSPHHWIALADRGKPRSVHVQRENPLDLRADLRHQPGRRRFRADDLAPVTPPESCRTRTPTVCLAALYRKRQLEYAMAGSAIGCGREPFEELDARRRAQVSGPCGTRALLLHTRHPTTPHRHFAAPRWPAALSLKASVLAAVPDPS